MNLTTMASKQFTTRFLMLVLMFVFISVVVNVSAIPSDWSKASSLIRQVNKHGPYFGLITVTRAEDQAFLATGVFEPHKEHPYVVLSGRRFRIGKVEGKKVVYVACGVGMVNAAAITQQMLDLFDITGIIHFGTAGNVNSSMNIGDVTIPKQLADVGLWDWMNPNGTMPTNDIAHLDVGKYNVPKGINLLGHIWYSSEDFYSVSLEPDTYKTLFWLPTTRHWLQIATNLEGMELEKCVNSSLCLTWKPKLVTGLKGSTANIFMDNRAYRDFLFSTFEVTSVDMESSAVVMTSLSNGFPVLVIRGLSDLAGAQEGENPYATFRSLASTNAVKAVAKFLSKLPGHASRK